ncbi:hypothetical protein JTB14_019891 [Gonioctena quinquepunctata]|nr:hypothetical protein JTB14_019891 [Gonioctena quinquepunctata]
MDHLKIKTELAQTDDDITADLMDAIREADDILFPESESEEEHHESPRGSPGPSVTDRTDVPQEQAMDSDRPDSPIHPYFLAHPEESPYNDTTHLRTNHIKHRTRKEWQRIKHSGKLKDFVRLSRELRGFLQEHEKQWKRILAYVKSQDSSLWNISQIIGRKYEQIPRKEQAMLDQHKVDVFTDYYSEVHRTIDDVTEYQKECSRMTRELRGKPTPVFSSNTLARMMTNPEELVEVIKNLPTNETPGPNGEDAILLKSVKP